MTDAARDALWTGPPEDPRRYRVGLVDGHPPAEPGGGGEGFVYRARTNFGSTDGSERDVALKLLLHVRPSALVGAVDGLETIATLDHPHLMRPIECFVGTALTDDPGRGPAEVDAADGAFDVCWLVAEWVDGTPLSDALAGLSPSDALRLVARLAHGVAALHDTAGPDGATPLTHCDIKPSNVRVAPDGRPVLIDYGTVGLSDTDARSGGTPGWLSPEVASGDRAGIAADLWGVGALAHHVLVGSPPRHDGAACARERMEFIGRRVGLTRADAVARHVSHLLESNPSDRPTDLRRWAENLDALLDGRRRGPRRWWFAGGATVVAIVVLVLVLAGNDRDDQDVQVRSAISDRAIATTSAGTEPATSEPGACTRELDHGAPAALAAAVAALDDDTCATGAVEAFVDASVAPLVNREGRPAGVVILCPDEHVTRLTAAEYASYREIAGRAQPENSVTYGGYPERRAEHTDPDAVTIELSTGGLIVGRRDDTQMFWIPAQARPLWEGEGGLTGRLGFPTSNVFFAGQELRLEFEHGYLTAGLGKAAPGSDAWVPFDVDSVKLVRVDDPGAELADLGDLSGHVLRQAGSTSWFVDDDLVRHWIPDGGTYECLDAEARTVGGNVSGYAVATLELGGPATCDLAN